MCGFAGFINETTDREQNLRTVCAMADRIAHRGPDQEDYYVDDRVSLGFRRLSIIDLKGGSQPIANEDGTKVIVFNGEIYNYRELRRMLEAKGYVFQTDTDTETILHGYEEYGTNIVKKLRGMFAFVIWDKTAEKLFGARDIFGIKPFFYFRKNEKLMFASEIKAFLANPSFEKELNEARIPDYLCFEYIPTEETLFQNVYKLPPASYMIWERGSLTVERYFDMRYAIDENRSLEEWERLIDETFRASVQAHCIADVEVGCFLSGGVDSGYTVCEVAKHNPVRTFSVGYAEESYSELADAQEFAEILGVENYSKRISADEYFGAASDVQYYMDEPLPNPSAIALYFLAQTAARQVKVVLSGEGADELFGGYYYYTDPLAFARYQKIPLPLRKAAAKAAGLLPDGVHGKRFLTRGAQDIAEYYIRNNYNFNWRERGKVLRPDIPAENPAVYTKRYFDACADVDDVTKMQYVDMQTWLVQDILVKADRMSMAHSLELRVPFLDREMLAVALGLPTRYRVTKEKSKIALRGAAIRQMPERTADRKKKGFLTPLANWLRQDKYYGIVKEACSGETAQRFFDTAYIGKLLDDHKAGKVSNMKKIWTVYSFILWYERYFA